MKKIIIIILILLIGFLIGFSLIQNKKQTEVKNQENLATEQISAEKKLKLNKYLQENISQLSPEKEVLGGKFYITNIEYKNSDQALIEYEDGHIALKAEITFKIENENITITNFKLINDNGTIITNEHLQCHTHEDCVPLPSCPAYECINKKYLDDYEPADVCALLDDDCAAYENSDCICQQGTCFNQNLMNANCQ